MARKTTTKRSIVARRQRVFVDTGGWYSLASADDRHHTAGVRFYWEMSASGAAFLKTDYILDETLTRLRYDFGHGVAVTFWTQMQQAQEKGRLQILRVDETAWDAAIALFLLFDDQNYSFTDCTSFVIAQREAADAVFAFDAHFRQFGFIVQLSSI